MYNSLVVRFLVKIWNILSFGYEKSIIKKVADFIKKMVAYLFFGSVTKDIFTSNKSIIEKSIFYRIYSKVLNFISRLIKSINNYIKSIGDKSLVYKNTKGLFRDDLELIRTISTFMLFFGIGIIVNNLARGAFSGRSYIVAISLSILSIIIMGVGENYKELLNSTFTYNFIVGLFTIDEGGDNWW